MWTKLLAILSKVKFIGKFLGAIIKVVGWLTPNGIHMIWRFIKLKGKASIKVDDVAITDESDEGFKATINLTVTSTNPEALTSVKYEIINKPPVKFD